MTKDNKNIPRHVAVIMDGNRRWAESKGVPKKEGHRNGALTLEKVIDRAGKRGVKIITAYAFSSENRGRDPKEIKDIMFLLKYYIRKKRDTLNKLGASLKVLGDLSFFPQDLQDEIKKTVEMLEGNDKIHINIALNYGGHEEIVRAAKKLADAGGDYSVEEFAKHLDTGGQPDVDLLIRTGDVIRTSNFLPWQSAYAELYFSEKMWPDFDGDELDKAIDEFGDRQRRFGK